MKYLILLFLISTTVNAEIYERVRAEKAGMITISFKSAGCSDTCWINYMFVNKRPPYTAPLFKKVKASRITGTCNGVNDLYKASVANPKGLSMLIMQACNASGCSEYKNLSIRENTCDGKDIYFYGD